MTLKFTHFVDLLERLEQTKYAKAITTNRGTNPDYAVVRDWFRTHDQRISRQGRGAVALLACLFPERLTQRSYNIREQSLSHVIPRILSWGSSRAQTLRGWRDSEVEFAVLVEAEVRRTENASPRSPRVVTVEQVDLALWQLAANSPYSAPRIREARNGSDVVEVLGSVVRRMKSREVKWLVRLMLKDLRVVQVPEKVVKECFHFLLPDLLNVVHDFETAVEFLGQDGVKDWPYSPSPAEAKRLKQEASKMFQPRLGRLVPRAVYDKARSLRHAANLARNRVMSVERKYDGEYCQIHIQREHDRDTVQLFSKSGKDSTMDREGLHAAITAGLDLAGNACKIKSRCILDGELVVWSRSQQAMQPFYKIRNHVRHGGRRLGRAQDGPPDSQEQLMIIFYDLLVLDDEVRLTTRHQIRRQHLKGLVKVIPGVSNIVERQLIDFSHQDDQRACMEKLRQTFALAITSRWEGLVLKGRDDPYLSFVNNPRGIKLRKDYLAQLGDAVDLCIIGGRLDPRISNQGRLKWNTFYLACLTNKEAYQRFGDLPSFNIVDIICEGTGAMPRQDLEHLNAQGIFSEVPYTNEIKEFKTTVLMQGEPPTVLFRKPFVVECYGAGFDKNSDCAFWTLRFPRISRIHHDRTIADTMDFGAMQQMAEQAQISPSETDEAEVQRWIQRLVDVEGKSDARKGALASPTTGSVPRTPHSATTASLSPAAARNRPASLPSVWKQVHGANTPATKVRVRQTSTQQTTTTSTRTPSTARTWASPDSRAHTGEAPGSESAPASTHNGLQSPLLTSPLMTGAARGKRRLSDAAESNVSTKRPRLVAGRTILETPTPSREEIDLTRGSSSITPARSRPPDRVAATVQSFNSYLSPKPIIGGTRQFGPIPIPLPTFTKKPDSSAPTRRTPSKPLNLDGAAESPRNRHRAGPSIERTPLAEMPSQSPTQRAPVSVSSPLAPTSPLHSKAVKTAKTRKAAAVGAQRQQSEQQSPTAAVPDPISALLTPASTAEVARNARAAPPILHPPDSPVTHNLSKTPPPSRAQDHPSPRPRSGPMSHADRLRASAARASAAPRSVVGQAASTTVLRPLGEHGEMGWPRGHANANLHPVAVVRASSPRVRSRNASGKPLVCVAPSAVAGAAQLVGRGVVDGMEAFVARVAGEVLAGRRGKVERAGGRGKGEGKARRRFVLLVDSRAQPRVVAEEVRRLAGEVLRKIACGGDGGGDGGAGDGHGAGERSDRHARRGEKVVVCVLDFRVVGWLERLRRERRAVGVGVPRDEEGAVGEAKERRIGLGSERERGRGHGRDHEHEHFVCAVHIGGDFVAEEGKVAARIVWRS